MSQSRARFVAVLLTVVLIGPGMAFAEVKFRSFLSGYSEVPAVSSPGKGVFVAGIGDHRGSIEYELSYALEGEVVAAHLHFGRAGTNGGVLAFLCGGGSKPECPPAPATVRGRIVADDILGIPEQGIEPANLREALAAVFAGAVYVNVHSTRFPGGEIRGQAHKRFAIATDVISIDTLDTSP